jgi:predicted ATPase with chaperone activity
MGHNLMLQQLNLSSLNPAIAENAHTMHQRNLRSPHHNLAPASILTGNVGQSLHSNADLINQIKMSSSSPNLTMKN